MTAAREDADDAEYLYQDTLFHQCLFDCADNRFLNDAYQTIALKMAALRSRLGHHPDHMAKSYREHIELLQFVRDGNVPQALEVLKLHIDRKEGSYWSDATQPDGTGSG
jgi:DNA-binding GntR family transcriptional regulator